MIDWPREVIIPILAALVGILGGIGVAAKTILPKWADTFIANQQKRADDALQERAARRELAKEEEANERNTQIALLSQVVQQGMASQNLNKDLIKFITERIDGTLQTNHNEIRTKLDDIDKRWIVVANKLGHPELLAGEVARLGDKIEELEVSVRLALNGNIKKINGN